MKDIPIEVVNESRAVFAPKNIVRNAPVIAPCNGSVPVKTSCEIHNRTCFTE